MKNLTVTCNNCKKDFVMEPVTKAVGEVEETGFYCPHCNSYFWAFSSDKKIRDRIQGIKNIERQMESEPRTKRRELERKRKRLVKLNKKEAAVLRPA